MEPQVWEDAGSAPFNNITMIDPLLRNPENGDYSLLPDSPAIGYGCYGFTGCRKENCINEPVLAVSTYRNSINVGGVIDSDVFWNADSIFVTSDIQIENLATVTIPAGAKIIFNDFYSIHVNGSVQAIGNPQERITFTSSNPDDFDWNISTQGAWNQIQLNNTTEENQISHFHYCVFEFSKSVDIHLPFSAGGVFNILNTSNIHIENCIFRNNYAACGAGIACLFNSNPVIQNNAFFKNKSSVVGSSIFCLDSFPLLINNTITSNQVLLEDSFFSTGSVHNYFSKPISINNIIYFNSTNYIENLAFSEQKLYYAYSNNAENFSNENLNIDENPLFVDSSVYELDSFSPCIDAGLIDLPSLLPPFDLDGNDRINGVSVDIGAFEFGDFVESDNDMINASMIEMNVYPNPFKYSTSISFEHDERIGSEISIYNIKGQFIRKLHPNETSPKNGNRIYKWDGLNFQNKKTATGMYLIGIKKNGIKIVTKKCVLIK